MNKRRRPTTMPEETPRLRFRPTAWAKLLYLRDYGETEVGGFAVTQAGDLLLVQDVQLVKQACSYAYVSFDDESVADFFDAQVDAGRQPEQFARIWLHTHPGDCPLPSGKDEETFARVFGGSHWAVMFILAQEGESYARLRFNVGPGGELEIPVEVDYSHPFVGSDHDGWEREYLANVQPQLEPVHARGSQLMDAEGMRPADLLEFDDFFYRDETDRWFDWGPEQEEAMAGQESAVS